MRPWGECDGHRVCEDGGTSDRAEGPEHSALGVGSHSVADTKICRGAGVGKDPATDKYLCLQRTGDK